MEQPFDGVNEIYNQKLGEVLNFFASKLLLYYSSSRLTLLLTLLDIPPDHLPPITGFGPNIIPLPSGLRVLDINVFGLWRFFSISYPIELNSAWNIFRDFLNANGQRYASVASACLKIILKHYQVPLLCFKRLSRHALTARLSVDVKHLSHWWCDVNLPGWENFFGTYFSCGPYPGTVGIYSALDHYQRLRSSHLEFLLKKSAYSDNLLNFARRRVFRFGYLKRNHPTYMKKGIFALAKYIHRVTWGTAEVKACESIWGHKRWFYAD